MARSIRIEYPGAFYHVMARANRREEIFTDDEDRQFFLKSLSQVCGRTGFRVHAWVLMSNHYHLLLETPEPNLVEGMRWLQNTYTRRFNLRHGMWGRLFGDRYKSVLVEGAGYYYETLVNYLHLNPARAGLVKNSLLDYRWSSLASGYALPPGKRPQWMVAAEGLERMGFADTTQGRKNYVKKLERIIAEEGMKRAGIPQKQGNVDARRSNLERGWYWGSQAFGEKLLKLGRVKVKLDSL